MATSSQPNISMTDALNAEKDRDFRRLIEAKLNELHGAVTSLTREVVELKTRTLATHTAPAKTKETT